MIENGTVFDSIYKFYGLLSKIDYNVALDAYKEDVKNHLPEEKVTNKFISGYWENWN